MVAESVDQLQMERQSFIVHARSLHDLNEPLTDSIATNRERLDGGESTLRSL